MFDIVFPGMESLTLNSKSQFSTETERRQKIILDLPLNWKEIYFLRLINVYDKEVFELRISFSLAPFFHFSGLK